MKLFENLKSTLGEETVSELTKAFNESVEDAVKMRMGQKIQELEEKSKEFVDKKVSALVESKEKELVKEYEEKYKAYSSEIEDKLDSFLDSSITESISENIVEDIAKLQMYSPIVEKVLEAFKEHYSPIAPKDADTALADALKEKVELQKMLDKTLVDNKKLCSMSERAAVRVLFTDKTIALTKTQKQKIWEMVKDLDFDTVERKIDTMVSLVEDIDDSSDYNNSVGGVGDVSGSDDAMKDGDEGSEEDNEEPKVSIEINKETWDSMEAIETPEGEEPTAQKKLVEFLSPYKVETEDAEGDGEGEYGEADENAFGGDEGTDDGEGEYEEPVVVTFEVPESKIEELKTMFPEGDFGDLPEDVVDALNEVFGNESEEGTEGGEEGTEDNENVEGADYSESHNKYAEWSKKWGRI